MADKLQVVVGASVELKNAQASADAILKSLGTIQVPVTIVPDIKGLDGFKSAVAKVMQGISATNIPAMAPTAFMPSTREVAKQAAETVKVVQAVQQRAMASFASSPASRRELETQLRQYGLDDKSIGELTKRVEAGQVKVKAVMARMGDVNTRNGKGKGAVTTRSTELESVKIAYSYRTRH